MAAFIGPQQGAWQDVLAGYERDRQKALIDRENELKMATMERANQMAIQKEDMLKQWLNPPTNVWGAENIPVDVGGFSTGGEPMKQVGVGAMGIVPASQVKTITQQSPEVEAKRKMAQLLTMGIPIGAELPEQRAERELVKQKESETFRSGLEEKRNLRTEERYAKKYAEEEKKTEQADRYKQANSILTDTRKLQSEARKEGRIYDVEIAKANSVRDKETAELHKVAKTKMFQDVQRQIRENELAYKKIIDPEGYKKIIEKEAQDKEKRRTSIISRIASLSTEQQRRLQDLMAGGIQ
jgi:hypothetical protein